MARGPTVCVSWWINQKLLAGPGWMGVNEKETDTAAVLLFEYSRWLMLLCRYNPSEKHQRSRRRGRSKKEQKVRAKVKKVRMWRLIQAKWLDWTTDCVSTSSGRCCCVSTLPPPHATCAESFIEQRLSWCETATVHTTLPPSSLLAYLQ